MKRPSICGGFCRICLCIRLCIFCGHFGVISEIQNENTAQIQYKYSQKTLEIMGLNPSICFSLFLHKTSRWNSGNLKFVVPPPSSIFEDSMARFTTRPWLALQLIFLQVQTILLIVLLLHYHNSIRRRSQLLSAAVLDPKNSPWKHLLENGDSSSFLLLTGLSCQAFYLLLDTIIPPSHHLR